MIYVMGAICHKMQCCGPELQGSQPQSDVFLDNSFGTFSNDLYQIRFYWLGKFDIVQLFI